MAVIKRKNSKYYYAQFIYNGRQYIKSTRTTNLNKAKRIERALRERLVSEDMLGERIPILIEDAFNKYLDSKSRQPDYKNAETRVGIWLKFLQGNKHFHSINSRDIEKFYIKRKEAGNAPMTLRHYFNTFRGVHKHMKRLGYLVPAVDLPEIKVQNHRLRYLSIKEEERLLDVLHPVHQEDSWGGDMKYKKGDVKGVAYRWRFLRETIVRWRWDNYHLVIALLDTGARYSEIAQLAWKDIDLNKRIIHLYRPKVRNESLIYMTDRLYEVMTSRYTNRTQDRWVFQAKDGGHRRYATSAIMKAFDKALIPNATVHTLRHTCASRLVQAGMSLFEVGQILGHSSHETTMRYAHLMPNDTSAKATEILNKLNDKKEYGPKIKEVG